MGIFGAIGKMAGSKVIEKVEDELTKKQNREQTSGYCNYIKNNMARISSVIAELDSETRTLIAKVNASKGVKLSFKEKGDYRKTKEKAEKSLTYMYLTRDFFTTLAKNASGLILKNEELMLVVKFAPYFDGVPVLDIDDDEDSDDSVLGAFKEVGQELKEAFISSKKDSKHFDFDEYMYRYKEKLEEYIIPDINVAIESFKSAMAAQDVSATTVTETPAVEVTVPQIVSEEIECSNCHAKLNANSKFCPECGNKIEVRKSSFCSECGEPVSPGSKFCVNCGTKIG